MVSCRSSLLKFDETVSLFEVMSSRGTSSMLSIE